MKLLIVLSILVVLQVAEISGHGRLLDPPARSTAWREFGTSAFPAEYTDQEMFCGGFGVQWNIHGGKCSICGEEWGKKNWEMGGPYYRGTPVRSYSVGATIPITAEITANHYGWFEFRLCNRDELGGAEATHACLDKYLLSDANGNTRFNIGSTLGKITHQLRLPSGVRCQQCVIQWKYNTGNSWGTDPVTGQQGLGFGPQEQFYGCSDVKIGF